MNPCSVRVPSVATEGPGNPPHLRKTTSAQRRKPFLHLSPLTRTGRPRSGGGRRGMNPDGLGQCSRGAWYNQPWRCGLHGDECQKRLPAPLRAAKQLSTAGHSITPAGNCLRQIGGFRGYLWVLRFRTHCVRNSLPRQMAKNSTLSWTRVCHFPHAWYGLCSAWTRILPFRMAACGSAAVAHGANTRGDDKPEYPRARWHFGETATATIAAHRTPNL